MAGRHAHGTRTARPDRERERESPLCTHVAHLTLGTRGTHTLLYSRSAVVVGSLAVDAFSRQLST